MMKKATINFYELLGSSYEIGYQLGQRTMMHPQLVQMQISDTGLFSDEQVAQMNDIFDCYCPGLNEELRGFAEAIGATQKQMFYYAGTYLTPGCSLLAVLPKRTENGHVLVARNYEFSHTI